jgi:hypothetical protein
MNRSVLILTLTIASSIICFAQKPTQTIRGVVYDAKTKETLPGANVVLIGENRGTTSDIDGNFILEKIEVGRYNLQVSFMGYEPVIIPELLVGSGREVVLDVALEQSVSELSEVEVSIRKDRPINSMASVSARTFSVEEARRYAGALDDPRENGREFRRCHPCCSSPKRYCY